MRRHVFFVLLFCVMAAGVAEAGQFRIARPDNQHNRRPNHGRRESRLEIVNEDDRGYAIDVDYRRNRLTLEHRSRGDIYLPGNSSITLTFEDDDNWRIYGDDESLEIEIRAGRTSTLRLETRYSRNRVGLFATVNDGPRRVSKQLFKYAERPGRPGSVHTPAPPRPPVHTPPPSRPQTHVPTPSPAPRPPAHKPPPPPQHGRPDNSLGSIVGDVIDSLVGDGRDGPGHRR